MFLKISQCLHKNAYVGVSFNKVAVLKSCNFIKKRLQYRCFPVNIEEFSRTSFFIENHRWLLLSLINAKRYRNGVNWLRSSVFTVNFEHMTVSSIAFIVPFELVNVSLRSEYVCSSQLKNHVLATTKTTKGFTLYEVKHQNNVDVILVFAVSAWTLNFYLASISFATLSIILLTSLTLLT